MYKLFDYLIRNGRDIGPATCTVNDMHWMSDRGREDLRVKIVVVVDLYDVCDQVHSVRRNIIEATDERRNIFRTRLCCKQRLSGGEAEGNVNACSFSGEDARRF